MLDKSEILILKRKARQRTSIEDDKLYSEPLTMEECGYDLNGAYNLGYSDCEIIMARKILDILDVKY